MSESPRTVIKPVKTPTTDATLRKLFLTLFLRGHSAQGQAIQTAPKSVAKKLNWTLGLYALIGVSVFATATQETFVIAGYLHAMSLMLVGMFLVSAAGETLFNKDESEILLHRPIEPKTLLWTKVSVLLQVSLYLSGAFNLVGLFAGLTGNDANGLFPVVHLLSCAEGALFSSGFVVLVYQLCLRWFGRQRLDNAMTLMQVFAIVGIVIGSQIVPRVLMSSLMSGSHSHVSRPWWLGFFPPIWFAGLDDAIAGGHSAASWRLAGYGLGATVLVTWLAFGKLAKGYESGLQSLNEAIAPTAGQTRQFGFLTWIARNSPVRWWLNNSVEQVGFILTAAYLWRDREVKLKVYPTMASVLIMPIMMTFASPSHNMRLIQSSQHVASQADAIVNSTMHGMDSFFSSLSIAFAGAFLSSIPMTALNLLSYSQQWKASEAFVSAPIQGPWPIQRGAMVAVYVLLVLPMVLILLGFATFAHALASLPMALPGLLLLPLYGRAPALLMNAIPLSRAAEEAKSTGYGCLAMAAPFFALIISGVGLACNAAGWLYYMLAIEAVAVVAICRLVRRKLENAPWPQVN